MQGELQRVIESLGGNLKNACEKQEEVKGQDRVDATKEHYCRKEEKTVLTLSLEL